MDAQTLSGRIDERFAETLGDLERLVRIPSCAFPGFDQTHVADSAAATAEILTTAGFEDVRIIEIPGGAPAVYGEKAGPAGAPTVLLYAHHDVQPPGPSDGWDTPPYEPVIRDNRMYGRGTSDDKCGIVMHAAAMHAFHGQPPVTVKVIVEGEEEATAEHLNILIGEHAALLACDAAIIADAGVFRTGVPTITTSVRGVLSLEIEVRVADQAQHSGMYGGPTPDAISALSRIIASCVDDRGNVLIPGMIRRSEPSGIDYTEDMFRAEMGLRPGVELLGDGELTDRLWFGPTFNVVGIDAPAVRDASFQIVPVARAMVTMRMAPEQDPDATLEELKAHLLANAPWGVEVVIEAEDMGRGYQMSLKGPVGDAITEALSEAWGAPMATMGMGGSIPLVPELAAAVPRAQILMVGPGDERSAAHSVNESVDLTELRRSCLAEALFFQYLADRWP